MRRVPRPMMAERAALVDSLDLPITALPNKLYQWNTCALSNFTRASDAAKAFQFFRINLIEIVFRPLFDTYATAPQGVGAGSVPQFISMIDKAGQWDTSNTSFQNLQRAGAKFRRFDDKNIIVKYKPSVLQAAYDNGTGSSRPSKYDISPWLSTDQNAGNPLATWAPSSVDHLGICFGVNQVNAPAGTSANTCYQVQVRVHFEYKKPKAEYAIPPGQDLVESIDLDLLQ